MMAGMNKKALALLGLGHLMVDLNTGALPALLPFLKTTFGLSYTMLGVLVLVAKITSRSSSRCLAIYLIAALKPGCYRLGLWRPHAGWPV